MKFLPAILVYILTALNLQADYINDEAIYSPNHNNLSHYQSDEDLDHGLTLISRNFYYFGPVFGLDIVNLRIKPNLSEIIPEMGTYQLSGYDFIWGIFYEIPLDNNDYPLHLDSKYRPRHTINIICTYNSWELTYNKTANANSKILNQNNDLEHADINLMLKLSYLNFSVIYNYIPIGRLGIGFGPSFGLNINKKTEEKFVDNSREAIFIDDDYDDINPIMLSLIFKIRYAFSLENGLEIMPEIAYHHYLTDIIKNSDNLNTHLSCGISIRLAYW